MIVTRSLGPMLARAMTDGKPVASDPIPLLRPDGEIGIVSCHAGSAGGRCTRRRAS